MDKCDFNTKHNKKIVLALGFFDSVHIGHKHLINKMVNLAHQIGTESAVFTFINSPFEVLNKETKEILTFDERCNVFESLGIDNVIYAKMDENFMSLDKDVFLDKICSNYDVKGIVCGTDYTYGRFASGNVSTLQKYCLENNIQLIIDNLVQIDNQKISSTRIRQCINDGNIDKINELLGSRYFIKGEVIHCAGRGRHLGFPTANILISDNKMALKNAVYQTIVTVNGKRYKAITNVGERPTFREDSYIIESYLDNFNEDIYGDIITVEFVKKLRDIINFNTKEELINQLEHDKLSLKELEI